MSRGRLITIEGIDGAGKTTLATGLQAELGRQGIDIELRREPGGVEAAERMRELVKDPDLRIGARAEALLETGSWVLLDRFVDSSLAYQGAGRQLGLDRVKEINEFATGSLWPDRTLLLVLDPDAGRSRSRERSEPVDRLEREPDEFFERINAGYVELQRSEPRRIRLIDASQPPDRVLAQALEELRDLL
jgi:dTMP kinase